MTAIYLVGLIPDWNSLDSVRHAHSFLEAVALVFFALLVLFDVSAHFSEDKNRERLLEKIGLACFFVAVLAEIAAYPYGQRNDALSEKIIGSLDTKARDAFINASNALTKAREADTKADAANRTSDEANGKAGAASELADQAANNVAVTQALVSARDIADVPALIERLRQFSGIPVIVESPAGDPEASSLCSGLFSVMTSAGMHVTAMCGMLLTGGQIVNIWISGPDDKVSLSLAEAISQVGKLHAFVNGPFGKQPQLTVYVGQKAPFRLFPQPMRAHKSKKASKQ